MSEQSVESQFEADVQIGKVWRYIDRHGRATIEGGRLSLCKRGGEKIAEAPLSEVWADVIRGSINLWMGGQRYVITPLRVRRAYEGTLVGAATNLARDVQRFRAGQELGEQFLRVVEAAGGQIGRPDKQRT